MSLNQRLKPLDSQRLGTLDRTQDFSLGELDKLVNALEMLAGHRQWHEQLNRVQSDLAIVKREVNNYSD